MESIHRQIEAEYREIRRKNDEERQRRIRATYLRLPQLKALEEETYRTYASLTADLFENGKTAEESNRRIAELQRRKKELLKQYGYPEGYLDTIYTCPNCHDTGYIRTQPCACYREKKRKYLYRAANLTPVMEQQSFSRFRLDYYSKEPVSPNGMSAYDYLSAVYSDCKSFVENGEYQKGVNLFLYGAPGLGKTFLCSCIAQELLSLEVPVLYQTAYRLFSILEDARFKKEDTGMELAQQFYSIPVLMIDDLGTEFVTSYTSAVLFDLINTRIQNNKSTVISSNLSLTQMKEQYSDRVQSRIFGEYKLLKFYGTDIRKNKI